jgi:uncharacterized protein (TIGR02996 family)
MHDEDGFLAAIRFSPADDVARLVFADWLDEQDDPACKLKAEFIRLELRMAEAPEKSLNRVRWLQKLQKLAAQLNPSWLAVVSHPKLEACRVAFRFECPKEWAKLAPTDSPTVRFCESCKQHVRHCATVEEAQSEARRGNCIALSVALVPKPVFLTPDQIERLRTASASSMTRVGRPLPIYELPPAPSEPQWSPAPAPEERENRRPKPRHRKKRQHNPRNIQRENWEEME